ncbi:hypothetical protein TRFO_05187 [Tritrichomonas foetus]|uniref:Transmembrane protein n=1 Tax=Tritrichomonas foetus TaxID=1144522 RepID=A0A1J4K7U7_9EUKA|nr:hypothetical protein TRFO_05187 [Tritrichomonas foetus]|eukprot:OHT07553.1 hypothetical protein TRFO_05187 [Tritrichomonas foetus]
MIFALFTIFAECHLKPNEKILFKTTSVPQNKNFVITNSNTATIIFASKKNETSFLKSTQNQTSEVISMNTSSNLPTVFFGKKIDIFSDQSKLQVVTWKIPQTFCSSMFSISTVGELEATISNSPHHFPLCIFADPFSEKYKLSTYFENNNIKKITSIDFYVGSATDPFSSCDQGTECVFWHTQPFFMRLEGNPDAEFSYSIRYQTESKHFLPESCFLGAIKRFPENYEQDNQYLDEFHFECKDEKLENQEQFKIIIFIILFIAFLIFVLHLSGVMNIKTVIGWEDEQYRFNRAKANIDSVKGKI